MTSQTNGRDGGNARRRTKRRKFFIPRTKQQFRTCLQRMSLQFLNIAFNLADKAMYLLGPILIALASALIIGLTYVYFRVILPMLAGTNWVLTADDWESYWSTRPSDQGENGGSTGSEFISLSSSILLALSTPTGIFHTIIVAFVLVNIIFNYYQCVKTSNSGPEYDSVVRELAALTGFDYPNNDDELLQCKKNFERKIYEKLKKKREDMRAASLASSSSGSGNSAAAPMGARAPANNVGNGDVESQIPQSSPLMASEMTNASANAAPANKSAPQTLPKIHNWQLLSPVEWGYCRYSSQPKPPRSHYDHVTKALVLNMDHYCPWMFNCIGYFNYRYFFNFLWFVATGLLYGTAICFPAFMNTGGKEYIDQVRASPGFQGRPGRLSRDFVVRHSRSNPFIPTPDERTLVAMAFMLCLCLCAAVLCLGGFHLYLVLSAQTTIEFHGNFAKRKKGGWKNPYSAGSWKRNWEMVYGTRHSSRGCCGILLAMLPSKRLPEFLPLPLDGQMIRRKDAGINEMVLPDDEEMDLTRTPADQISNRDGLSVDTGEMEFLMEPKDNITDLVARTRANHRVV